MQKVTSNQRRLALVKQLKSRTTSADIQLIKEYVESLREDRLSSLLKTVDATELAQLSGELKALTKILSTLENDKRDPTFETKVIGQ
jgi:hypothetical protein